MDDGRFVPDLFVAREDALDRGGPALAPADVLRSDEPFPLALAVGDIF
ncbi:hypothetical protein [Micromonospora chersina]